MIPFPQEVPQRQELPKTLQIHDIIGFELNSVSHLENVHYCQNFYMPTFSYVAPCGVVTTILAVLEGGRKADRKGGKKKKIEQILKNYKREKT